MKRYLVRLAHDAGITPIMVTATSEDAAIMIAMACERCPRRAILSCVEV